jgi:hypothetical protein
MADAGLGVCTVTLTPQASLSVYDNPNTVAIADINNDGKLDIITASAGLGSGYVSVLKNLGNGMFAAHADATVFNQAGSGVGLAVADFNGDGYLDLASTGHGPDQFIVLLNDKSGGFEFGGKLTPTLQTNAGIDGITSGDFNGDGHPDLAATSAAAKKVYVVASTLDPNSGWVLGSAAAFDSTDPGTFIAAGKLSGNSVDDLVTANSGTNNLTFLKNSGAGMFPASTSVVVGTTPTGIAIGEIDGNSGLDLVTSNHDGNNLTMLQNKMPLGFSGYGLVSFPGSLPNSPALADMNGDGAVDLLVPSVANSKLALFENNHTLPPMGPFIPYVEYPVGNNPVAVAVGDLNGDGKPDAVVANKNDSTVTVLLNSGVCIPPPPP